MDASSHKDTSPSKDLKIHLFSLFLAFNAAHLQISISYHSTLIMFNPFGTWGEAGQAPSASQAWNGGAPAPSVYGALPYPSDPASASFITFYFTSFSPNIFNCTIVGSTAQVYYKIVTDNNMPGYTVIKNSESKNVSLIEWQSHPFIEIRGILSKQQVRGWLGLTQDKRLVNTCLCFSTH